MRLPELYFEVVHRTRCKFRTLEALSKLRIGGTDKTSLDEELPVLIIDGTEDEHDAETEYFDRNQARKDQTGDHIDSRHEETQQVTVRELLNAQTNDCSCTQKALTIGLLKYMFSFDTEDVLV